VMMAAQNRPLLRLGKCVIRVIPRADFINP
jgi:hypothetical protein